MPRHVELSEDDIKWLQDTHQDQTHEDLAKRFNCCVDTIKRILMRLNLQEFDGAKYTPSASADVAMWSRPCMECGTPEERPKNWYFCRSCRSKKGFSED